MKSVKRLWKTTEIAEIRARYPYEPAREIAADLRRSYRAVHMMAQRIGVAKAPGFLRANAEMHGFGAR